MSACDKYQALPPNLRKTTGTAAGLGCYIDRISPRLNFAFRFQGGYTVEAPLSQFAAAPGRRGLARLAGQTACPTGRACQPHVGQAVPPARLAGQTACPTNAGRNACPTNQPRGGLPWMRLT